MLQVACCLNIHFIIGEDQYSSFWATKQFKGIKEKLSENIEKDVELNQNTLSVCSCENSILLIFEEWLRVLG